VLASYTRAASERTLQWLISSDPDYDSGPDVDQFAISFDEKVIESVFAALTAASTPAVSAELLAATATMLEGLSPGYTDTIRGHKLGPVPTPLETTSAQLAWAAARVLADETKVPRGGDREWDAGTRLLDKARVLTRQAANE